MAAFMSWKPVIVALILTPLLLVAAFIPCGVGHGNCLLWGVLFPYALLVGDGFLSLTSTIAQFPLYGLALGSAGRRGKSYLVGGILLVIHVLAVVFALQVE